MHNVCKNIASFVVLLSMVTGFAWSTYAEERFERQTIRLAHTSLANKEDPYHFAALQFKELVEKRSGGTITVNIFPNSQYGNEREMFESVIMGNVDMAIMTAANISAFSPAFIAVDMPFIFADSKAAWAALDGPAGQAIGETLLSIGVKGLAWGETGFRQMVTKKSGITTLNDFKGKKVRSVENAIYVAAYRAWGANPSPLAWSETLTAFQQGAVDGFDIPISIIFGSKLHELADYVSLTGQFYNAQYHVANLAWFEKLSPALQTLLQQAVREAADMERAFLKTKEDAWLEAVRSQGMNVVPTSAIDLPSFKKVLAPLYEKYAKQAGGTFVQDLLAAAEKAAQIQ